jgi:hypothetical protein
MATPPQQPEFVQRIFARERRVESTTTIQSVVQRAATTQGRFSSTPAVATSFKQAPAVPMVTRRARVPAPTPEPARTVQTARRDVDAWLEAPVRFREQAKRSPIPLTPSELGRLTDHVVNAIDRRFTAHRERFGRI